MRVADLSGGAAKLANALKQLHIKWAVAKDTWDDARSRSFHETHIEPLMPDVKDMLDALGRLAEVLDRACRDVADDRDGG
jgi:hypothetical protein